MSEPGTFQPAFTTVPTQHALLVAWGHYAQEIGLLEQLTTVPIRQKSVIHKPHQKLTEFLCGILSGIEYLSDLSAGPSPLAKDAEVALAWQLGSMSGTSGVSRTLRACDQESEYGLQAVLDRVSQPFLERAVGDLLARGESLLLDADLTGRAVSPNSTSYTDARFGYMQGEVRLGYQLAELCVQTHLFGRQWVCGHHHPGDTVSATCLLELVRSAEQRLGCHPRRRTELVRQRMTICQQAIERLECLLPQSETHQREAQERAQALCLSVEQAQTQVQDLHSHPISKHQDGPYSRLSRLKRRITSWQKRIQRVQDRLHRAERAEADYRKQLAKQRQLRTDLQRHLAQLEQDNGCSQSLVSCRIRLDAGFSSGENITALIELGYDLDTRSGNNVMIGAVRKRIPPGSKWAKVGHNAQMIAWSGYRMSSCPYPLVVGLERIGTAVQAKYSVLIRYQDQLSEQDMDLRAWFCDYNARQTIEAGNKEEKTVFKVQHMMTRSRYGIRIQAMLTIFAANFVRWADRWLRTHIEQTSVRFDRALSSPKRLVRVAANSPAFVDRSRDELRVRFSTLSSFPGVVLCLSNRPFVQLELPLFQGVHFSGP